MDVMVRDAQYVTNYQMSAEAFNANFSSAPSFLDAHRFDEDDHHLLFEMDQVGAVQEVITTQTVEAQNFEMCEAIRSIEDSPTCQQDRGSYPSGPTLPAPPDFKPPFTYTELIRQALRDKKELTVSGIYQWIIERYPYFKQDEDRWKNSVRHNLSMNPHFRKGGKAAHGSGHFWRIITMEADDLDSCDQMDQSFPAGLGDDLSRRTSLDALHDSGLGLDDSLLAEATLPKYTRPTKSTAKTDKAANELMILRQVERAMAIARTEAAKEKEEAARPRVERMSSKRKAPPSTASPISDGGRGLKRRAIESDLSHSICESAHQASYDIRSSSPYRLPAATVVSACEYATATAVPVATFSVTPNFTTDIQHARKTGKIRFAGSRVIVPPIEDMAQQYAPDAIYGEYSVFKVAIYNGGADQFATYNTTAQSAEQARGQVVDPVAMPMIYASDSDDLRTNAHQHQAQHQEQRVVVNVLSTIQPLDFTDSTAYTSYSETSSTTSDLLLGSTTSLACPTSSVPPPFCYYIDIGHQQHAIDSGHAHNTAAV